MTKSSRVQNPGSVYWMDVSNYAISLKLKIKEAKCGKPKKKTIKKIIM
jgi:hypothetical protein